MTEFLALNVTAMFCPRVLSHRTAKTANGVGLFAQVTSRCQTNIETFYIEVQHTGILPSTQDRRFLAIGVIRGAYHLAQNFENSGRKVNGKVIFRKFQPKIEDYVLR